jgi:hypothetical protein
MTILGQFIMLTVSQKKERVKIARNKLGSFMVTIGSSVCGRITLVMLK